MILTAICLSSIVHQKEGHDYIAVPLFVILSDNGYGKLIAAAACLLLIVCSTSILELFPELYKIFVKLATSEWKIFLKQISYENSDSGNPVLAVFIAGLFFYRKLQIKNVFLQEVYAQCWHSLARCRISLICWQEAIFLEIFLGLSICSISRFDLNTSHKQVSLHQKLFRSKYIHKFLFKANLHWHTADWIIASRLVIMCRTVIEGVCGILICPKPVRNPSRKEVTWTKNGCFWGSHLLHVLYKKRNRSM